MFPNYLEETVVQSPKGCNLSGATQVPVPSPRVRLFGYPYGCGLYRVSPLMSDTFAPPDKLVSGPFELVVGMPEYTVGAASRVKIPSRIHGPRWGPSLVEGVRWSSDEKHAWSVYTKYNGGDVDEDVVRQMLNAMPTTRVLIS
jgi:hypothetical protein